MRKSRERLSKTIDKERHKLASLSASFSKSHRLVANLKEPLLLLDNSAHQANRSFNWKQEQRLEGSSRDILMIERGLDRAGVGYKEEVKEGAKVCVEQTEVSDYNIKDNNTNQKTKDIGPKSASSSGCRISSRDSFSLDEKETSDISVRQEATEETPKPFPQQTEPMLTRYGYGQIVTFGNIIISPSSLISTLLPSLMLLIIAALFAQERNYFSPLSNLLSKQQERAREQKWQQYSPQIYLTLIERYQDSLGRQKPQKQKEQQQQHLFVEDNNEDNYSLSEQKQSDSATTLRRYDSTIDAFHSAPKEFRQSQRAYHLDMMTPDTRLNRALKLEEEAKLTGGSSIVEKPSATKMEEVAEPQHACFTFSWLLNSSWLLLNYYYKHHYHHLKRLHLSEFAATHKPPNEDSREMNEFERRKQGQRVEEERKQVQKRRQRHYDRYQEPQNHYYYLYHHHHDSGCCPRQNQLSNWNNHYGMPATPLEAEVAGNIQPLTELLILASAPCHCKLRDNDLKLSNGRSLSQQNYAFNLWPFQNNQPTNDDSHELRDGEEEEEEEGETKVFEEITHSKPQTTRDEMIMVASALKNMSNAKTTKMTKTQTSTTTQIENTNIIASLSDNIIVKASRQFNSLLLFANAEQVNNLGVNDTTIEQKSNANKAFSFNEQKEVVLMEKALSGVEVKSKRLAGNKQQRNRLIVRHHRRRRHTRHGKANNLSIIKQSVQNQKSRYLILIGLSEHHSSDDRGDTKIASRIKSDNGGETSLDGQILIGPNKLLEKPFAYYKQQPDSNAIQDQDQELDGASRNDKELLDSNEEVNNDTDNNNYDNNNSGNNDDTNSDIDKQTDNAEPQTSTIMNVSNNDNNNKSESNNNTSHDDIIRIMNQDGINITLTKISNNKNNTNSSEENTQCEEPDQVKDLISSLFLTITFAFFYFIIFIIGFLGNTLTLLAMRRKREKISTMDIFISNLACSDIMLCIVAVVMTPIYLLYHKYWNFGSFMCKAVAFAQGASVYISTLTLISIAYVRYQLIVHPLGIPMKFCTAILLNCLIWIISFSINVPYLMHMNLLPEKCTIKFCVESWDGDNDRFRFSLITITVQFFLPFFLVTFFYSSISRKLREQKELRDNQHKSEHQKYNQRQEVQNHEQKRQHQEKISFARKKLLELTNNNDNNEANEKRRRSSSDMMKANTIHSGNDSVKQLVSKVGKKVIHQRQAKEQQQVEVSNCDVTNSGSKIVGEGSNLKTLAKKEARSYLGLFSRQKLAQTCCSLKQEAPTTTTTVCSEKILDRKEEANEIEALKADEEIEEFPQKNPTLVFKQQNSFKDEEIEVEKNGKDAQNDLENNDDSANSLKVSTRIMNDSVTLPQISVVIEGQLNNNEKHSHLEVMSCKGDELESNSSSCIQANEALQKVAIAAQLEGDREVEAGITANSTLTTSQKAATIIRIRPSESLIELSTSIYNESHNFPGENEMICDHPTTPQNRNTAFVLRTNNGFTNAPSSCTCSYNSNLPSILGDTKEATSQFSNNVDSLNTSDKDNHQTELDNKNNRRSMRHHLLQTLQQTFNLKQKKRKESSVERDNTNGGCSTTFTLATKSKSKCDSESEQRQKYHETPKVGKRARRRSAEQVTRSNSRLNLDLRQEQSCAIADSSVKSTNYLGQPSSTSSSKKNRLRQQQKQQKLRSINRGPNNKCLMNATNADILALKEQRQRERDERLRQTNRKLLWMVIMFVVAWLPLNLFNLIQDYSETVSNSPYTNHVFLIVHLFASSSVCYNPILYAWMSDNYRQELRDILPVFILKHFACLLGEA